MRCGAARVGEIFRNLITHALKHNDKPQKWIAIGCLDGQATQEERTSQDLPTRQASVSPVLHVHDNGIGIPKKHHDAIFRTFKRLHTRDTSGYIW
jgi:chemotaxis family two-component system sensor kinase Cph1